MVAPEDDPGEGEAAGSEAYNGLKRPHDRNPAHAHRMLLVVEANPVGALSPHGQLACPRPRDREVAVNFGKALVLAEGDRPGGLDRNFVGALFVAVGVADGRGKRAGAGIVRVRDLECRRGGALRPQHYEHADGGDGDHSCRSLPH